MENGRDLKKMVAVLSRDSDRPAVQDFVSGMDRDYFSVYTPREIRTHLKMSVDLNADHPVQLKITPRGKDRFAIVIVAFDYFSEFSILCGLLTSYDLDIQNGNSHTFSD
jgi:glutamate-ammonia-ligase adenylyltransferase